EFASKYGPPTLKVLKGVGGVLKDMAAFGMSVVKFLWEYKEVIAVVLVGLLTYKTAVVATRVAETALALWRGRHLIVMYAVTVAQRAHTAPMKANGPGLVITAITLLVAGLVLAYKKSDTFRAVVNKAWASIKTGLAAAWSYIKPVLSAFADFLGKIIPPVL